MEVRNSNFAAFIDVFTSNTYVMVIMSDPSIRKYINVGYGIRCENVFAIFIPLKVSLKYSIIFFFFPCLFFSVCSDAHQHPKREETL